jgi:hypothetical protein
MLWLPKRDKSHGTWSAHRCWIPVANAAGEQSKARRGVLPSVWSAKRGTGTTSPWSKDAREWVGAFKARRDGGRQ